ncbi:MAG: molybdopterin biosynthesis protein [Pirellulaceae bacterium]
MVDQKQFLDVVDRDVAEARFQDALVLDPLGQEQLPLEESLGRVLSENISAAVDVPSFDRSNYDGYAVRADDTYGAMEEKPCQLVILDEVIATAVVPSLEVAAGTAISIATGGMVPRGADAVVLVEHTDRQQDQLLVRRAVTPGFGISFAGTDIGRGETVLFAGTQLTSRETGVLAALGIDQVPVFRRPTVGILSTGDEIIAPGESMQMGMVFDSNARILADAVRELGGEPVPLGIVPDQVSIVRETLQQAIASCDLVVLSGGTSKGAGDICYEVVQELKDPGIVAHGVALKPGKPICLAATAGKGVVILPGFPTSAIFTFHEFVAPVIRALGGRGAAAAKTVPARLAIKVNSEIGRREFLLVGLVQQVAGSGQTDQAAFPMGKGSGSVTTFSRADGFITIDEQHEIVEAGELVDVQLLGQDIRAADLVVIGSHCVGLDVLLGEMNSQGMATKLMSVGSQAGLEAARRGQCDLAGIHLLDEASGEYNGPFLDETLQLIPGYLRQQGILFRSDDSRLAGEDLDELRKLITGDERLRMVNRNQGSGTRILIDQLLDGARPDGYAVQPRSHNAVAAAIEQGSADWGVGIEQVARASKLGFVPLAEEHYDFVCPASRRSRPAVEAICQLLQDGTIRDQLAALGLKAK